MFINFQFILYQYYLFLLKSNVTLLNFQIIIQISFMQHYIPIHLHLNNQLLYRFELK